MPLSSACVKRLLLSDFGAKMSGNVRLEGGGTCVMASLDLNSEDKREAKIKLEQLKTRGYDLHRHY